MNITVEALLDFIHCPVRYRYEHIDGRTSVGKNGYQKAFHEEIHKLCFHTFNYIQDGRYPSEYLLRQKWGKLWSKNKTIEDLMLETNNKGFERRNIPKKLEKLGVRAIEHIHKRFKEDPGIPMIVGKRTVVQIGRHQLEATVDLIRIVEIEGREIIELVDFQTRMKDARNAQFRPMTLHIRHDIATTAASYAFRQLIGQEEDRIVYYDVINDEKYETVRDENDYKTLEHIMDNVERAMEADIFYPVMNDRCFDCPFQMDCRKQNWYKGE